MQTKQYWFPAKRYGWGWGVPSCWQGWLTMGIWLGLLLADGMLFAARSILLFQAIAVLLTSILIAICWWKGEPPRWRWGT